MKINLSTIVIAFAGAVMVIPHAFCARASAPSAITPDIVNDPKQIQRVGPKSSGAAVLRAQVLLDRARFSPGEIDAAFGSNLRKAIAAFQVANGVSPSGTVDEPTWALLNRDEAPILIQYKIAPADVAGPFAPIPTDMIEKSKMQALGYASPVEALSEMFHVSPKLLQRLNPGKNFGNAGEEIVVPNVDSPTPLAKGAKVIVDKSDSTVTLVDASGKTIAHYPASTGSEHDPLPLGTWKIKGVAKNPVFHYNPKLFWDADPKEGKAKIPPGPNNPVGVVWIDLSKEHYGIHGTPEPSTIGKTQSHGCIRLTNWDAAALAQAVSPGMAAILQE
ncbi:MAG TPA: L,D-transpeptidase [Burkholderiales bacterium]|nr:L,D-transpeptidase [Burkholderiales bacterium]